MKICCILMSLLLLTCWTPAEETLNLTLGANVIDLDGKASRFREHNWHSGHSTVGIEDLRWDKHLDGDLQLTLRARGIAEEDDYGFSLRLEQPETFFLEVGAEHYRKYYDDVGGFYDGSFNLDEDLHLDIGRVWARGGWAVDENTELVLSYEYRYKDGEKSLLEWNRLTTKQVYPAFKVIDESAHVLQLDISRQFEQTRVDSNTRFEYYSGENDRSTVIPAGVEGNTVDKGQTVAEEASYNQLTSSSSFEHWHEDWLLVTGGYHYLQHRGDAEFAMNTLPGGGRHDKFWFANDLDIDQRAHLLNLGAMLLPREDVQLSLGLEVEDSGTDAYGDVDLVHGATLTPERTLYYSDVDSTVTGETLELRYRGLPLTTIYAKGAWRQNDVDREEEALTVQTPPAVQDLLRDTDEENDRAQFRIGFSTSPKRWLVLNSYLQHSEWRHDYDHQIDEAAAGVANTGYSAFISAQDIDTDEAGARLVLKPSSWLRTSLNVRVVDQQIDTFTDAASGSVVSGDYEMRIYSLDTTITPHPAWLISCGVSKRDSRTRSPALDAPDLVADYEGDVWTASANVQVQLNDKTRITLGYAYWDSENEQDNLDSLPINVAYTNHVLSAGLRRQVSERTTAAIQYRYTDYRDHQYRGELDYNSHGLYALVRIRFK